MTDYYVDSVRGLDAQDGSTPALAKKTLNFIENSANKLLVAGDNIYLACDSEWNITEDFGGQTFLMFRGSATLDSPITITSYIPSGADSSLKPKLHNYQDIASGDWTDITGGLFTYTVTINVNQFNTTHAAVLLGDVFATRGTSDVGGYTYVTTVITVNSGVSDPTTTYGRVRLCYIPVFRELSDSFQTRDGRVYDGLECSYANQLLQRLHTTSTNDEVASTVTNCTISDVSHGFYTKAAPTASGTSTMLASYNSITRTGHAALYVDGEFVVNSVLNNNTISYTNLSDGSNGGITINGFGSVGGVQNNIIRDNGISWCVHGRGGTTFDGSGIYIEEGSII